MVECDCGGQRGEAARQPDPELVKHAGAVAFEAEDVLGGEEDRLDSLADRRQVRAASLLVFAVLAVGAAYGVIVWIFQEGHLESLLDFKSNGAIVSWMPLFMFVVLLWAGRSRATLGPWPTPTHTTAASTR